MLWHGEDERRAHEVRAGDCLVHLALEQAHTLNAGPDGLDVLAFGMRTYADSATYLPRAGVAWLGATWVEAGRRGEPPVDARGRRRRRPTWRDPRERPPTIVNLRGRRAEGDAGETVAHVAATSAPRPGRSAPGSST